MKKAAIVLGSVFGALVVLFLLIGANSPSDEVVTLATAGAGGEKRETSLWVVDEGDAQWLRAGNPKADWVNELRANPQVEFVRAGVRKAYTAVFVEDPAARERLNQAMAVKYGASNGLVSLWGDHSISLPIRLDPR